MTCTYPDGKVSGWCERHQRDHAMLRALDVREARLRQGQPAVDDA